MLIGRTCCIDYEETRDSGVRNSGQEYPQKPVFPLGRDSSLIVTRGHLDLTFEPAVINFHCNYPHRFAIRGERQLLLLQRFWRFSVPSDPDSAEPYFNFDVVGFNAG